MHWKSIYFTTPILFLSYQAVFTWSFHSVITSRNLIYENIVHRIDMFLLSSKAFERVLHNVNIGEHVDGVLQTTCIHEQLIDNRKY